jgi:hypothetical protein
MQVLVVKIDGGIRCLNCSVDQRLTVSHFKQLCEGEFDQSLNNYWLRHKNNVWSSSFMNEDSNYPLPLTLGLYCFHENSDESKVDAGL